jgi:hypothetical protein
MFPIWKMFTTLLTMGHIAVGPGCIISWAFQKELVFSLLPLKKSPTFFFLELNHLKFDHIYEKTLLFDTIPYKYYQIYNMIVFI